MVSRSLTTQNLAPDEMIFVREFAYSAGAASDAAVAAIRAGSPRKHAEQQAAAWLAQPHIVEALHMAVRERLDVEVVSAIQTLADLAANARSEQTRLSAANALLDRSAIGPVISRSAVMSANFKVEDLVRDLRAKADAGESEIEIE